MTPPGSVPFPDWFASIVQVPAPTNVTLAPSTVQMPALPAAAENVTVSPEVAVAATVYAGSPLTGLTGGVDVKLIVCETSPTVNVCCACGAAR